VYFQVTGSLTVGPEDKACAQRRIQVSEIIDAPTEQDAIAQAEAQFLPSESGHQLEWAGKPKVAPMPIDWTMNQVGAPRLPGF